jgi:uncharacterized protein YbjT (DUF2867 family)
VTTLVTGASGDLGRRVMARLGSEGRAAGRKGPLVLDLATGAGLADAVAGAETVLHCASSAFGDPGAVDVAGTRRLVEAVRATGGHLVYISIVGIERLPSAYYNAKLAAEAIVETAPRFTLLRATQFHTLLDRGFRFLHRLPLALVPWGVPMHPVDADDVADRLVALAAGPPAGRVRDLGGPEIADLWTWAQRWRALRSRRALAIPVWIPPITGLARGARAGALCCPDGDRGRVTFEAGLTTATSS